MAQQTGSISFEATNAVHLSAEGQYESLSDDLRDNYYTKSEFTVAPDKILSTVKEHSEQSARPNLTPWFSVSVDDTSYWAELHCRNASSSNSEGLHGIWDGEDGWAHVTLDSRTSAGNDGSKNCYMNMHVAHPKIADKVTAGGKYTWLIEVRNLTLIAGASGDALYVRPSVNNATLDVFNTCSKEFTEDGAQWGVVTVKSDLSVLTTKDARGYCYIHTGCYADFDLRVSLYEGEYEGPYKPYVDQSLITRVSTAETAIEQNAEAITLRATKTEAQQMAQPNLSPWFSLQPIESDTEHWNINNGNTTFTPLEDGWVHLHNDNSSGTGVKRTDYQVMGSPSVTPGADYTWLFEYRNNNSTGNNQSYIVQSSERVQFWGNNVVKVLEGKSGGATTTLGPNQDFPPETDGVYVKRVLKKAEAATSSHLDRTGTLYLGCLVCYAYAGAVADYDLRVSVYEGEYTGPYKPYSGTQLYASQAQLKVANDQIDLRVEKSGVIAAINASTEAEGGSAVKISADKVQIDGTAVFTAIEDQLDAAYDAKGAAATVQGNLDNLAIGGTNLLGSTANPSSKQIVLNTEATSTFGDITNYSDAVMLYSFEDFDGYSNALKWTTSGTGNRGAGWYTKVGALKAGETYTFSCKVMSSVATTVHTHTAWRNGSATASYAGWTNAGSVAIPADEWVDYSYSFKPHSSAKLDWEFYVALCFSGNSGGATFRIAHAKLERGNRASDWSPAPEDQTAYVDSSIDGIQVGGRNYILNSASISASGIGSASGSRKEYLPVNVGQSYMGIAAGTEVVISFDLYMTVNTANPNLQVYNANNKGPKAFSSVKTGGGSSPGALLNFTAAVGDVIDERVSVIGYINDRNSPTRTDNFLEFYSNYGSSNWFSVSNLKMEIGNRATDWSPAPEDVTSRTQRIYYRTSSSTAPTIQYMPTAWVTETGDKWAANSTTVANWTAKATKLTNGTTKYPYLFTCEQRQMGDGTLAYTTVLLDETTTVIDGGTIITGSVHANSLDADSVKANIVQTTDLNASKITSGDIATERMSANIVKAVKAKVSDLYALVAKIGGFVINATSIFSGTAVTSNADNSIALSTADFTRTVNGTSRAGLRFAIGSKFGVEGDGTLYANGANITSINAGNISSGSISADRIKANVISAVNNGTGTINADKVNVSAITIGQSQVTGLSTDLDNKADSSDLTAETNKRKAIYGTCSTAAGTTAKVVTCPNFELYAGAAVTVTFSTANTAIAPSLNVNSTGAKDIWYNNAAASNDNPVLWGANATLTFVYDGSHWVLDEKPPSYAVACSTAAATRDKAATVTGALVVNGTTVAVSFSTANTYVAASLGFNLSGTGDDVIRVDGAVTSASNTFTWAANTTLTLVRRGLCWDVTGNDQASKTATTYLTEGTSNGLMVHRSNNATTGVRITDDVDIVRNGNVMTRVDENGMTLYDGNGTADSNVVASFGEDLVELGKGSENAVIEMCNGSGQISLNRVTSTEAWLEFVSNYWLMLKGIGSSIELGDEFIYEQGGQTYYAGNVHIESSYNSGERVAEIWLNAEGMDGQTSSIDAYADNINLNGTLTLSTPLADSNLPTKGSAGTVGPTSATSGATLAVPYITTDAYGRVTDKGTYTHTIGSLAASAVTSGTFNAARIPNLNASKITAGTLNSARLPTVPVNKGGTGQTGVTTVTAVASFISVASGVTVSSVRVTVWGKLVHAYVTAKPDAAKTAAWVVGTVVDAYRPNAVVTGKPYYTGVDSARIQTNGQMQITACGAVEVGVSFTYLLA